jgi:peptidoglycan hydrolase-like protein with peptidoglycan-binding domain
MSRTYGGTLVSWWDWQDASAAAWNAISQKFGPLEGFAPQAAFPTLSIASSGGTWAGDLVVWAQEHLLEAGQPVQIDGAFGSQTRAAVLAFQLAHGLQLTGMVDQATWQALLRYPRPNVVWTTKQGQVTASSAGRSPLPAPARAAADRSTARMARAGFVVPVPWSAHLPARGYEIPRDLGAGRRSR